MWQTKEYRPQRGRRRGLSLTARTLNELREARLTLGISQTGMARELGCSQAHLWRIEANRTEVTTVRLAEMASLLRLEVGMSLHPLGDPIRDKGQQALAGRFSALPSPLWSVTSETLLPLPGDLRSWEKLLRLSRGERHAVGVDLETRIRTSRPSCGGRGCASETVESTGSSLFAATARRIGR